MTTLATWRVGYSAYPPTILLAKARAFIDAEGGVHAILSWGKFWLALLSLYRWEGVNPVIPELWALPLAAPMHPSRYYCHTRLIYMSMATLYAERFQTPATALTLALRDELFPEGFEQVDFAPLRKRLREGDLFAPPSRALEALVRSGGSSTACERARRAKALLAQFRKAIRWELSVSSHTSISPVSGLLNILALWFEDPNDPDVKKAVERFDCWIWEDDRDGLRVTGARSAIWDTSFLLCKPRSRRPHVEVNGAMARASDFREHSRSGRPSESRRELPRRSARRLSVLVRVAWLAGQRLHG